jgi:hypothetical protein
MDENVDSESADEHMLLLICDPPAGSFTQKEAIGSINRLQLSDDRDKEIGSDRSIR